MQRDTTEQTRTVILGGILIGLGLLLLIMQWSGVNWLGRLGWPLFILVPGLALFVAIPVVGRPAAPLAVPASVVTTTGLILFVQNALDIWQTWAYAWALYPMAIGLGLMLQGRWSDGAALQREGRRVALIGLVLFAVGLFFFEGIIDLSGLGATSITRWLGPVLLIGAGLLLLLRQRQRYG
jgi:hypothetical protein